MNITENHGYMMISVSPIFSLSKFAQSVD